MKTVAIRNIERASNADIEGLGQLGVATAHEAQGRTGLMQPYMRPIYPRARLAGSAVTVLVHPGDNWMIHVAIELCQPGDVLVVGCSTDNADGFFGDEVGRFAPSPVMLERGRPEPTQTQGELFYAEGYFCRAAAKRD